MGGLIRTKGTLRLIAHFNSEFSTWLSVYQAGGVAAYFNTNGGTYRDLLYATNQIMDNHSPRGDHRCLLPPSNNPMYPNLETRWKWFLTVGNVANGALSQANHNAIAGAIYTALIDNTVQLITFDAVEIAHGDNQAVAATTQTLQGVKYAQILLKTAAMPAGPLPGSNSPPALDYQFLNNRSEVL